jgi:oligogalacturonide transport system substrate-binding protein
MKKDLKKLLTVLLAGCVCGSILAGCGSASGTKATTAAAAKTTAAATTAKAAATTAKAAASSAASKTTAAASNGKKITMRCSWWGGDARHQALLKVIDLYKKSHPNVEIQGEYQGYDGYYEKMMTTLSSGTAADIMMFKREWLPDVQGSKHYLADLSKLPVNISTLAPGLMEKSGTYAGEKLLFSTAATGQVLYVNSDFAKNFGVDTTKAYSWDDLMKLGKAVHEKDSESYLMTADIDVLNRLIIPEYIGQVTGGSLINDSTYEMNFTQKQMQDAFQLILDLYDSNTVEPFGEGSVFTGKMDQNSKWVNGKIGMLWDVTTGLSKYKASVKSAVDVMPIPRNSDAKCSGVDFAGNAGFVVNDKSANKEEAAKFLDFMMNDAEASLIIGGNFGYNSTSTAIKALEDKGKVDPTLKKAVDIAQKDSMTINTISSNTELETARKDILQEVIYKDITPEKASQQLVDQYKKLLSELKGKKK